MINDLRVIEIFNKLVSLKIKPQSSSLEGENFSIFRGRFDFCSDFAAARRIIEFPIPRSHPDGWFEIYLFVRLRRVEAARER